MDTTQAERGLLDALNVALRTRRSVRRYLPRAIGRQTVDALLDAATTAPSAHNRQPWRFVVIESAASKHRLAQAMGAQLRTDRLRDGDPLDAIEADVSRSHARLTGAPVLVLICMCTADMDRYADDRRAHAERAMAIQGTAMAAQSLLLAAHAAGLHRVGRSCRLGNRPKGLTDRQNACADHQKQHQTHRHDHVVDHLAEQHIVHKSRRICDACEVDD